MLYYLLLIALQWLFLIIYHYTTNVHYSRIFRPLFGIGYFFIIVILWFFPQPQIMIGSRVSLFILDTALVNVLLGFVPFAIGAYFGLGGVLTLGLVRTSMLRNDKLICLGVYKLVRHPQYFGVSMLHLGFALILGSIYNLVYSPFMFLVMYLKASIEEKYLKRVFGTEYEECFRDVPMFIPRLKKP